MQVPLICSTAARLLFSVTLYNALTAASPVNEIIFKPDDPNRGYRGGVASESRECSEIGRDLMARGGNAVDSLVGTTFCVGVIGMYHSGIGGGGFVMIRDSKGHYEAVDFRESAPATAYQEMYHDNVQGSKLGGLSVGVPSEVAGLEYIHEKYGVLPWKTVMSGAIKLARDGFKVSSDHVRYISSTVKSRKDDGLSNFLLEDPVWAEDFAPNGTLLEVDETMTRRRLANTLEKISNQGSKAFYTGKIAKSMIKTIQGSNGTMTLKDLKDYTVVSRPIEKITYRGVELHGIGSPANGAVALNILKIMEQYDPDDYASDLNLTMHRFDEAMRWAYSARLELGDPSFVEHMDEMQAEMISGKKAKEIRDKIWDNSTRPVKDYDPKGMYTTDSAGTSQIATADRSGMATSLTTTINLLFGAQIMDPLSGVILNNEMNDFSIPGVPNEFGFAPSPANFIRPHKRPLSSITPIIASLPSGALLATVGAAGGSRIVSATAFALWHTLEHDMSLTEALGEPRIHDQLIPNEILTEYAVDNSTVKSLRERGHQIKYVAPGLSAVQGVWRHDDGGFEAASEPRQKNSAGLTL